jgi:hypothetical protein
MPSAQDFAERLREQAYKTLLPQIEDLERELQNLNNSISGGVRQVTQKLEALQHIELPTTRLVLDEILEELNREKDLKANALSRFTRAVRQKETQEEILALLLDCAHSYFPRVALFAVRGNEFIGWSSRGYSEEASKNISACSFLRSESPHLQEALEGEGPMTATDFSEDNGHLKLIRNEEQEPLHILPLRALQRPVALLLASGPEETLQYLDMLSILVDFTVLRLENIAFRILYELKAAEPEPEIKPAQEATTAAPEPVIAEKSPAEAPKSAPEQAPPEETIFTEDALRSLLESAEEATTETELVGAEAEAEEPVRETEVESEEALTADSLLADVFDDQIQEKSQTADDQAASVGYDVETPAAMPAVPADAVPEEKPQAEAIGRDQAQEEPQATDEQKLHAEARKFARLLVSEIKLYNESHVLEGRENKDLYIRLKRDIDRSREMYEQRVSPIVSQKIDHFHEEIIRTLGNNDSSTLGSEYPGPRVES